MAMRSMWRSGHGRPRATGPSDPIFQCRSNCERFLFDDEATHGAVDLRVAWQELSHSKNAGNSVYPSDLGTPHGMGAMGARLEADGSRVDPNEAKLIPPRDGQPRMNPSGQKCSSPTIKEAFSRLAMAPRVPSAISKLTSRCVPLRTIAVRCLMCPAAQTSAASSRTSSQPRSLLSRARSKSVSVRVRRAIRRRT